MANDPRQVRVDNDLWIAFGEAAADAGTDRAKLINAFIRRYVEAMTPRTDEAITNEQRAHSAA